MATRPYWISFGASAVSGLNPTFIQFRSTAGSTLAPPSITEPGSFGMYLFNYDPITQVAFICDGATTGLAFQDRYVKGVLDPFQQFGVTLVAIGNTSIALGISGVAQGSTLFGFGSSLYALGLSSRALVGDTSSSFGTELSDPSTVFGFLKRAQETREGNETYTKATGDLDIYSRGSSQLLASKTVADSSTSTTKT
jgi:hypothetical protein